MCVLGVRDDTAHICVCVVCACVWCVHVCGVCMCVVCACVYTRGPTQCHHLRRIHIREHLCKGKVSHGMTNGA